MPPALVHAIVCSRDMCRLRAGAAAGAGGARFGRLWYLDTRPRDGSEQLLYGRSCFDLAEVPKFYYENVTLSP